MIDHKKIEERISEAEQVRDLVHNPHDKAEMQSIIDGLKKERRIFLRREMPGNFAGFECGVCGRAFVRLRDIDIICPTCGRKDRFGEKT